MRTEAAGAGMCSAAVLPIVQYWHRRPAPPDVAELLETVAANNPRRPHLLFDREEAAAFIQERFGLRQAAAFAACAVPAMQADYFRCCALYALGGIWLDADCRCLASLDRLLEPDRGRLFEGAGGKLNNYVLAFGAERNPLLGIAVDLATTNIEQRIFDEVWMVAGPGVLVVLGEIARDGGFDRTFEGIRSWVERNAPERREHVDDYLEAVRTVIGDGGAVVEAFEGVETLPGEAVHDFVRHGGSHLSYKGTEAHFPNFPSSIFR